MDKKLSRMLIQEITEGNLKYACKLINSTVIDEELGLNIFISCCTMCNKVKDKNLISLQELYRILEVAYSNIEDLKDGHLMNYFQSVFFILKYILEEDKLGIIFKMKNILVPTFVNNLITNKQISLYVNICNLIHNRISNMSRIQPSNINRDEILLLGDLSLLMYSHVIPINTLTSTKVTCYFKLYSFFEIIAEKQERSYLQFLEIAESTKCGVENVDEMYRLFVYILKLIMKTFLTQGSDLQRVSVFIKNVLGHTRKIFSGTLYVILSDTLAFASDMFQNVHRLNKNSNLYLIKCYENLKAACSNGLTGSIQETCACIHLMLFEMLNYFNGTESLVLVSCMCSESQSAFCNLVKLIENIIAQAEILCPSDEKCPVTKNLVDAVNTKLLIGHLAKTLLSHDIKLSNCLYLELWQSLEECCNYTIQLKSSRCSRWSFAWSSVGVTIFNISVTLYSKKNEHCAQLLRMFIKNLVMTEGVKTSTIRPNILNTSLKCLMETYLRSSEYKNALVTIALNILYCPDDRNSAFNQWCQIKSYNKKDIQLQEQTLVNVLKENHLEACTLIPVLHIDSKISEMLLLYELEHYKLHWPSKVPMASALRMLSEVADNLTFAKNLICIWGDGVTPKHESVPKLIQQSLRKMELEVQATKKTNDKIKEKCILLGTLRFMHYNNQMADIREKIIVNTNNYTNAFEASKQPRDVPANPDDECDLYSSYDYLKLEEHAKTRKHLDAAIRAFNVNILENASEPILNVLKDYNIYDVAVRIAHEYMLQCHTSQSMQTWFLSLRIAKLLNNNIATLECIGFLLQIISLESETAINLIKEADNLILAFNESPPTKNLEELATFYINKSSALFNSQNITDGLICFEHAKQWFSKINDQEKHRILKARIYFLHFQYLTLPCGFNVQDHSSLLLVKPHQVLEIITEYYKSEDTVSTYGIHTLFQATEAIADMYRWLHLPREVRCYSRALVLLAQQLALPLRTANLLNILAHADLQSMRYDDCQVKIDGLGSILCLSKHTKSKSQSSMPTAKGTDENTEKVEVLVSDFQEMMLDLPTRSKICEVSMGSPILVGEPFQLPTFTDHEPSCDCFQCSSVEYRGLVFTKIHLNAQLHIHRFNVSAAQDYFSGALKLYDILRSEKYATRDNLLQNNLDIIFCSFLLDYGNALIRINNEKKSVKLNAQLIKIMSECKYKNLHLYNEAVMQKINLISGRTTSTYVNNGNCSHVDYSYDSTKTPENKQSSVIFTTHYSPRPDSPPKKLMKSIRFNLFPAEEQNNGITQKSPTSKAKVTSTNYSKTPCKTPAPRNTKVEVYTPVTVKSNRKGNVQKNNATEKQSIDSNFLITASPDAYNTPGSLKLAKTESGLELRTKLLTEKLKSTRANKSAKLVPVVTINDENSIVGSKRNNKTGAIRKNLMNELTDPGETSKSSRNLRSKTKR